MVQKKPIVTEYRDIHALAADGSWLEVIQKVVEGPDQMIDRIIKLRISKEQLDKMVSRT